jgi:hypothetical protein
MIANISTATQRRKGAGVGFPSAPSSGVSSLMSGGAAINNHNAVSNGIGNGSANHNSMMTSGNAESQSVSVALSSVPTSPSAAKKTLAVATSSSTYPVTIDRSYTSDFAASGVERVEQDPQIQITHVATVKRRLFGTGPFDRYWLNLDCCGLFCAALTYGLHAFACYVVCNILIPPWMSTAIMEDVDNGTLTTRALSTWGQIHMISFCTIAALAVCSHFQAMTTDPGAVPPDARPLPDPETLASTMQDSMVGNNECRGSGDHNVSDVANKGDSSDASNKSAPLAPLLLSPTAPSLPQYQPAILPTPKRLCRRCKSFKPHRAHHCSICNRCIVKMDHHCKSWFSGTNVQCLFALVVAYMPSTFFFSKVRG